MGKQVGVGEWVEVGKQVEAGKRVWSRVNEIVQDSDNDMGNPSTLYILQTT